jgi:small-conductance mechanosensitive channel
MALYGASLWAQQDVKEQEPEHLAQRLDRIERALARAPADRATIKEWFEVVDAIKNRGARCVPATEKNIEKATEDLYKLGQPVKGEPIEVIRQRKSLQKKKLALEKRLGTCQVLIQRGEQLLAKILQQGETLRAQQWLRRGPTISDLLRDERLRPATLVTASRTFVRVHGGVEQLSGERLPIFLFALAAAALLGRLLRHVLRGWAQRHLWHAQLSSQLGRSLVSSFAHYAPHLLLSTAAASFFFLTSGGVQSIPFLGIVAVGLLPYFLTLAIIHALLAPFAPAAPFFAIPSDAAAALARPLKVLALLVFLGYLLFGTLLSQSLPEPFSLLARAIFAMVLFGILTWAIWLLGRMLGVTHSLWLRIPLVLALFVALVVELVGYRNLSLLVLRWIFGTLFAAGLLMLLLRLSRGFYDGLSYGRAGWQRRVRQALTLQPDEPIRGLIWLRLLTSLFLWIVFGIALLRVAGLPRTLIHHLYVLATEGFTVGSLHIVPVRWMFGLAVLMILLALSGWIRSRLGRRWLPRTRIDRGAREATVTMSGYVGITIAFIVALSVSGVEFSNLALIAGALSVGIGFGLQNVVNNFVSGLILLFERPIKTGDWIVVGDMEGYVKSIRIRSTQIQTFDRADVIVPNSDLISNPVTNWMLKEARGRIRVPVGVAYGSDTEKVREILLQVARDHPSVISDGAMPEPIVLFLAFGDSSLNFELRCYVENIDYRVSVTSELNFAIDTAFHEHGIQIPFPQRDIHVRSWSAPQELPPVSKEARKPTQVARPVQRRRKRKAPDSLDGDE